MIRLYTVKSVVTSALGIAHTRIVLLTCLTSDIISLSVFHSKGTAKVEKAYMASHLFQTFPKQRQSLRHLLRLGLEQAGHLAHFPRVSVLWAYGWLLVISFAHFSLSFHTLKLFIAQFLIASR